MKWSIIHVSFACDETWQLLLCNQQPGVFYVPFMNRLIKYYVSTEKQQVDWMQGDKCHFIC